MSDIDLAQTLSRRRGELASFDHAYAVAVQNRLRSGIEQFVIETGDPMQPYRTVTTAPANDRHVLAHVA